MATKCCTVEIYWLDSICVVFLNVFILLCNSKISVTISFILEGCNQDLWVCVSDDNFIEKIKARGLQTHLFCV